MRASFFLPVVLKIELRGLGSSDSRVEDQNRRKYSPIFEVFLSRIHIGYKSMDGRIPDARGRGARTDGRKETPSYDDARTHLTSRTEFGQQMRPSDLPAYLSLNRLLNGILSYS